MTWFLGFSIVPKNTKSRSVAKSAEHLDVPQRTRPPSQQRALVSELKRRILTGRLPAGSKLPTRRELSTSFNVSTATLQRAIDHLVQSGFLATRSTQGTYVSEQLPHLTRIALAYEGHPDDSRHWTRFHTAVMSAAERIGHQSESTPRRGSDVVTADIELVNYFGLYGHMEVESVRDLIRDVYTHRLAGVIHVHPPFGLMELVDLSEWPLPQVEISTDSRDGFSCVYLDHDAMLRGALKHLAERKPGQRTAVIELARSASLQRIKKALAFGRKFGLDLRPNWIQFLPIGNHLTVHGWVNLLFDSGMKDHPEALVVTDENLVEPITAALASMKKPPTLDIIAHANFPLVPDAAMPVEYLGFDSEELLAACLACIDSQRADSTFRTRKMIKPQFGDRDS